MGVKPVEYSGVGKIGKRSLNVFIFVSCKWNKCKSVWGLVPKKANEQNKSIHEHQKSLGVNPYASKPGINIIQLTIHTVTI